LARALVIVVVLMPAVLGGTARADLFELKEGGQIEGQTVSRTDGGGYVVRTTHGAEITLDRQDLARIVERDPAYDEYIRRSRAAADTADAHRELAAWCREHKLLEEADHHLARVVELDPADEEARRSLGYLRVGNRWLTSGEMMAHRGMQFYDGKYRTRQDIAIRERNKERDAANVDWYANLRLWRGWLDNRRPDKVAEAQALITAINDSQAAPALVRILENEEDDGVFEMLLRTLGQLDHPAAVQSLVAYSLDPGAGRETRAQCLDYLMNGPYSVSIVPYVQALKNKDNRVVNLAGAALAKIGDAAAISPLIDALVTTHRYQVQADSGGGSPINAGFNPTGGGGGLSMGGNGPKIISQNEQNERVLQALVKLSGNQNFEYDKPAWRAWFVDMQMRQRVNARRDE
jgi:HEAT repeat protein